jgi:hypothetical protein
MPYIDPAKRLELTERRPENVGELNYVFTLFIAAYCRQKGISYQTINDVLGALEGAKLEFYRRIAAPYENQKLLANGDVYVAKPPALEKKEEGEKGPAPH